MEGGREGEGGRLGLGKSAGRGKQAGGPLCRSVPDLLADTSGQQETLPHYELGVKMPPAST